MTNMRYGLCDSLLLCHTFLCCPCSSIITHCTMALPSLIKIWPNWVVWLPFSKLRVISGEIFGVPVHSVSLSFTYSILPSHFFEFWLFQINYNGHAKYVEGISWILPSKSGSKYFCLEILWHKEFEDICTLKVLT